jgi:hypothetical protein
MYHAENVEDLQKNISVNDQESLWKLLLKKGSADHTCLSTSFFDPDLNEGKSEDQKKSLEGFASIRSSIGMYSPEMVSRDNDFFEMSFERFFQLDDRQQFKESYFDFIVMFSMLEMYGVVHVLLAKLEENIKVLEQEDLSMRLRLLYLRALTF